MRSSGRRVCWLVFFMGFLKCDKEILKDKRLDIYESMLLCLYIEKYTNYGRVIVSDSKDSEYLKIDRKYVGKKRKHLEELGYIKCFCHKGKQTELKINSDIINNVNKDKSNED